jgi:hypothetical protein
LISLAQYDQIKNSNINNRSTCKQAAPLHKNVTNSSHKSDDKKQYREIRPAKKLPDGSIYEG